MTRHACRRFWAGTCPTFKLTEEGSSVFPCDFVQRRRDGGTHILLLPLFVSVDRKYVRMDPTIAEAFYKSVPDGNIPAQLTMKDLVKQCVHENGNGNGNGNGRQRLCIARGRS